MSIRELTGYSRDLIKGKRCRLLLFCMIPIGAELFFRTAEASLYSLMLYFGSIKPIELFTGKFPPQTAVSAVFSVLRSIVIPPLWCGLAARLMMLAEARFEQETVSDIILSGREIRRSVTASLFVKLISAAIIAPGAAFFSFGAEMLSDGADSGELIIATNLIAVGISFVILWASVRLGAAAVPFILCRYRDISAVRAVFRSFRFMRGRKHILLKLMLFYLPPVLTIAAAPWMIPEWAAAFGVTMTIFMKEDEACCERDNIQGRNRAAQTS